MTNSFLIRFSPVWYDRKPFEQIKSQILTCSLEHRRQRDYFEVPWSAAPKHHTKWNERKYKPRYSLESKFWDLSGDVISFSYWHIKVYLSLSLRQISFFFSKNTRKCVYFVRITICRVGLKSLFSARSTYFVRTHTYDRIVYSHYEWLPVRLSPRTNDSPNEWPNLRYLPTQ